MLAHRIRVDRRKWRFLNTMTSEAGDTIKGTCACMHACSVQKASVFVWTSKYDSKTLRVDADFFSNMVEKTSVRGVSYDFCNMFELFFVTV